MSQHHLEIEVSVNTALNSSPSHSRYIQVGAHRIGAERGYEWANGGVDGGADGGGGLKAPKRPTCRIWHCQNPSYLRKIITVI